MEPSTAAQQQMYAQQQQQMQQMQALQQLQQMQQMMGALEQQNAEIAAQLEEKREQRRQLDFGRQMAAQQAALQAAVAAAALPARRSAGARAAAEAAAAPAAGGAAPAVDLQAVMAQNLQLQTMVLTQQLQQQNGGGAMDGVGVMQQQQQQTYGQQQAYGQQQPMQGGYGAGMGYQHPGMAAQKKSAAAASLAKPSASAQGEAAQQPGKPPSNTVGAQMARSPLESVNRPAPPGKKLLDLEKLDIPSDDDDWEPEKEEEEEAPFGADGVPLGAYGKPAGGGAKLTGKRRFRSVVHAITYVNWLSSKKSSTGQTVDEVKQLINLNGNVGKTWLKHALGTHTADVMQEPNLKLNILSAPKQQSEEERKAEHQRVAEKNKGRKFWQGAEKVKEPDDDQVAYTRIKVRMKRMISDLVDEFELGKGLKDDQEKALFEFLCRLTRNGMLLPTDGLSPATKKKYLLDSEKAELKFSGDNELGRFTEDMNPRRARMLVLNFLVSRCAVTVITAPTLRMKANQAKVAKNLKLLATVLYAVVRECLTVDGQPPHAGDPDIMADLLPDDEVKVLLDALRAEGWLQIQRDQLWKLADRVIDANKEPVETDEGAGDHDDS